MEFEFKGDGTMRYANNSMYRGDGIIRKKGKAASRRGISESGMHTTLRPSHRFGQHYC